jgi:glycosyltransferase involved in cell wall biosynthesis
MREPGSLVVLLSTWNGEKYLRPLMESVLSQSHRPLHVAIRDDGSTDGTRAILDGYRSDRVEIMFGDNVGVPASFWLLLKSIGRRFEYVAFCDQDDVWVENKMARAISRLRELPDSEPALYSAGYIVTDERLRALRRVGVAPRGASFENALVENIATGCTIVLNAAAASLIASRLPQAAPIHDWWMYLVVSAFGAVITDDFASLYYRQHGGNAIGTSPVAARSVARRLSRQLSGHGLPPRLTQAREFDSLFGGLLDEEKQVILHDFIGYNETIGRRFSQAALGKTRRQHVMDEVAMRFLILFGRV